MLGLLLFLGIAVPATELFLLILISQWIGFWSTIGLILVTGVAGALLWRWQGFGVFGRFRTAMTEGMLKQMTGMQEKDGEPSASPIDVLLDGAMIFFAGGLLLTPGVLTDILGLLLLIPPTRYLFKIWIYRWFKNRFQVMDMQSGFTFHATTFGQAGQEMRMDDDEDIIEGEIISRSSESKPAQEDSEPKRLD